MRWDTTRPADTHARPTEKQDAANTAANAAPSSIVDRQESLTPESLNESTAGTPFDLVQTELHARGKKSAPVQPPNAKKGDSSVLYIEGVASMVPFAALDAFWRALWSIQAAALGVDRAAVQYAPAAQLERGHLMASAHYSMCPELVDRLAEPAAWSKVDLGLRLLRDPYLWDAEKLGNRYPGQPWEEMLQAVRAARDEISGPKLACEIEVEFTRIGQVLTLDPELAPCRPPVKTLNEEKLIGRSVGFKLAEVYLMHFSMKNGHASIDLEFKPGEDAIKQVRDASREHAPLLEVEVEVLRHDDVVVSRTLKSMKVICESLFRDR